MTTASSPAKFTISDKVRLSSEELYQPTPQRLEQKLDLDDAFSVHEDEESASFDFDPNTFMKDLQSRDAIAAIERSSEDEWENPDDEAVDMQNGQNATYHSTDASISTLDSDAVGSHRSPATPPHASSSAQSMDSEASPSTPPDDPAAASDSQLTNVVLSRPSHSVPRSQIHEVDHAYPNVIINASKSHMADVRAHAPEFSQSVSKRPPDWSSTSEPTADAMAPSLTPADGNSGRMTQSVNLTSPSLSPPVHRSLPSLSTSGKARVNGPSAFEKVVSKTRPPYLPPKQKDEDEKHSKEWEEMMQRSRLAERRRREELEARRLAREFSVEANTWLWERAVVPDWKKAMKDPNLRKLWWNGVPTKLRSAVWERAIGNGLALSKDTYKSTLARAKNLIASKRFPTTAISLLESDIATTLQQLHIFNSSTGPLYGDLRDLLCAWVVSRADEGLGYVEGVAKIGGMLLLNLTGPAQAFLVMRNLLERGCLRAFYGGPSARDDVEAYYRIFDTLLADGMPKVYFNFKQHQISPSEYLPDWLLPLFLNHLPLEACSRIWDVFLLEGDAFLFRAALAVLASIESRLFFPDRKELMEVLKGENKAALEVAKRDATSPIRSEHGEIMGPRYEIYHVNEESVWERVEEMAEWWKESTWQRLILRELPDL
ncbi:rab-GTPase-TBC domain-containing protein [Gautieria morchelliformis]|nr:rab-GTPase-TBC domain-containing protein [Gautieria morchelliformis]